jgi:aerobic-type carbon monoxide dehydrogenase small subunit (CoxS/CutS family)
LSHTEIVSSRAWLQDAFVACSFCLSALIAGSRMLTALTEKGSKGNVDHFHQFLQCQSALELPLSYSLSIS